MLNILFLILKPLSLLTNSSSLLRESPVPQPWWAESDVAITENSKSWFFSGLGHLSHR